MIGGFILTGGGDNGTKFIVPATGPSLHKHTVLTVTAAGAPVIPLQPANKTARVGKTAKFTVAAAGSAPRGYQWKKNGADIAGANGSTYITPAVSSTDNGTIFSVVVSNSGGAVTSNSAILIVK